MSEVGESAEHAPTWVCLHGWGSDSSTWQALLQHLPGDSQLIDLPGFGRSQHSEAGNWQQYLDEVIALLPPHCILLGWSLGGMLASEVAARAGERVQGLVTIASNPCFVAREDWPTAMAEQVYQQFYASFTQAPEKTWLRFCALQAQGDDNRKTLTQTLRQQNPPAPETALAWQRLLQWLSQLDTRQALRQVRCPQLHLLGEGDALVPMAAAHPLAAASGGQVQVLSGRGHAPHIAAPGEVAARIAAWLGNARRISKSAIAKSFAAAVPTYDAAAHVQRLVAEQVVDAAAPMDATAQLLDLGCGTGFVGTAVQQRSPNCHLVLADLAHAMSACAKAKLPAAAAVAADAEALPFAPGSFDLVLSSLALQWCPDLTRVGREVQHCLRPGGRFVFSTLGPETLKELKHAWQQVDGYVHVNEFKSAEQVNAEMSAAGLQVQSLRRVPVVLRYAKLLPMLQELKAIGAHNMNPGRRRGLSLRAQFRQLERAYAVLGDEQGLLPVTYDVFLVSCSKL